LGPRCDPFFLWIWSQNHGAEEQWAIDFKHLLFTLLSINNLVPIHRRNLFSDLLNWNNSAFITDWWQNTILKSREKALILQMFENIDKRNQPHETVILHSKM
jgi:hypothetical protein